MNETWYTRWRGTVGGPFPLSVLQAKAQRGELHRLTDVSLDGATWRQAWEIENLIPEPKLAPRFQAPVAPPPLPDGPPPLPQESGAGEPERKHAADSFPIYEQNVPAGDAHGTAPSLPAGARAGGSTYGVWTVLLIVFLVLVLIGLVIFVILDATTGGQGPPVPAAPAAEQTGGLTRDELRLASPVVVAVWSDADITRDQVGVSQGSSGVARKVGEALQLVTNKHCLGLRQLAEAEGPFKTPEVNGFYVAVKFRSGVTRPVRRFAMYRGIDLALLEVSAVGLTSADYVVLPPVSAPLREGDEVVAIGTPLGLEASHTYGHISAFRDIDGVQYVQFDAAINAGSSGGPLLLKAGEESHFWIGVNTLRSSQSAQNFAIREKEVFDRAYQWYDATPSGARAAIGDGFSD